MTLHFRGDVSTYTQKRAFAALQKGGTWHWLLHKIVSFCFLLLSFWFLFVMWPFLWCQKGALQTLLTSKPDGWICLAWFVFFLWHSILNIEVIIDDYVHDVSARKGAKRLLWVGGSVLVCAVSLKMISVLLA